MEVKSYKTISSGASDHFPVQVILSLTPSKKPVPTMKRSFKKFDVEDLSLRVAAISIDSSMTNSSTELLDSWSDAITAILDQVAPIKSYPTCTKRCRWMTNEIRALISQRDATARKLERRDLANREEESAKYKRLKSMVKSQLRRGAKEYGSDLLAENNTRDAWKFLRDVSFTTTKSERTSMDINILNDYLAKTVQNSNAAELYIADSCDRPDSFTLTELLAEDVLYTLSNLPTRTATGPDGLSATLLRQLAPALATNLTKIMNHSLAEGKVPDQWKKANVVAVWKNKGAKNAPENYRPISILPVLARLFEKIVAKQLSRL